MWHKSMEMIDGYRIWVFSPTLQLLKRGYLVEIFEVWTSRCKIHRVLPEFVLAALVECSPYP